MREGLYCESGGLASLSLPERGPFSRREENGYTVLCGTADDGTDYVTLTEYDAEDGGALADAVAREFGLFLSRVGIPTPRSVLVAGIGNAEIEADSLGPRVSERIAVGRTGNGTSVFSFASGVPEATGIETEKLVPAVARLIEADLLVTVDSLAALSPCRLCRTVQISGGARPGSGVERRAGAIGTDEAGCPVVALGVPTAVRGRLSRGEDGADGLFTACGIGASVVFYSVSLAHAINTYFRS